MTGIRREAIAGAVEQMPYRTGKTALSGAVFLVASEGWQQLACLHRLLHIPPLTPAPSRRESWEDGGRDYGGRGRSS
jgi:hypothetical protein